MSTNNPYCGKCLVIITGASRGFGREIAQVMVSNEDGIFSNVGTGSKIILISRDEAELEKTKQLIEKTSNHFEVSIVAVDLSNVHQSQEAINGTLNECSKDFNHVLLFNNAGTVGDPGKSLSDYNNIVEIQKVFNLNVISSSYLISKFCKSFEGINRVVVHTSSLAALQPFKYMGLYTSSKACLDMFINNLVVDCPEIRALNYAPGPMDTQMAREIRDRSGSPETRSYFTELFDTGKIINPRDSVKKLMMLLRKNDFTNGAHIDFYDI